MPVSTLCLARIALIVAAWSAPLAAQDLSVNAGPDRVVVPPATNVTLRAHLRAKHSEVPTGTSVMWTQISGPNVAFADRTTLTPTVTPSQAGRVRLRVLVFDRKLGFDSDEVDLLAFGSDQDAEVSGEARKWHKLALTFQHSASLAEGATPNPFLDFRLTATFVHAATGALVTVPGFFAADGNAAESSASAGDRWRVNFTPDRAGDWYYLVSFRSGTAVALDANPTAGTAVSFDGANGSLAIECADPNAPGLLAKGRLEYVGEHHLRFAETGEAYLKNGAGSPENFFGYYEFDGTSDQGGEFNDLEVNGAADGLHHFNPHLSDYVDRGVPLWQGNEGRRIFGALSYLASRGVNSLYTVTYNLDGGDGQEVWPWSTPFERRRFDVSKLAQWERVLDHMTREGIVWHVVTQETENDQGLNGGALGLERQLYYRELIARFSYAPGLVWNLGEENTNTPEERRAFADAIRALDPNAHPITVHNVVGDIPGTFGTLLGTHLELVSLQGDPLMTPPRARQLVLDSAAAGRPWVVNFDEQTPGSLGVVPDSQDFWHDTIRKESLWPMLLVRGGGCEWYFGHSFPNADLDCEDFRSRDNLWILTTRALDFLRAHVPFSAMQSEDALATGNGVSVLALRGQCYVVYLPEGGPATLDLEGHAGPFSLQWFDARNGGVLVSNGTDTLVGPGIVALGAPPGPGDWAALVRTSVNHAPEIEGVFVEPSPFTAGRDFAVRALASDPDGPLDPLTVEAVFVSPNGATVATLPLQPRGGRLYSFFQPDAPPAPHGTWRVDVTVTDAAGASATTSTTFEVE